MLSRKQHSFSRYHFMRRIRVLALLSLICFLSFSRAALAQETEQENYAGSTNVKAYVIAASEDIPEKDGEQPKDDLQHALVHRKGYESEEDCGDHHGRNKGPHHLPPDFSPSSRHYQNCQEKAGNLVVGQGLGEGDEERQEGHKDHCISKAHG